MDARRFYAELFAPLQHTIGAFDPETLAAIVGFEAGGPLSFRTIGRGQSRFTTYVSCELAVRAEQRPTRFGRYELLTTCDDEEWVRSVVTAIGGMSLEASFDDGHSLDIGPWTEPNALLQGVLFEKLFQTEIDGGAYGVLRILGVTRPELEFARAHGASPLVKRLSEAGVYPNTTAARTSVI